MDILLRSDDRRTTRAFGASVATAALHALFLVIVAFAVTRQATSLIDSSHRFDAPLVFMQAPGPGGGGGGSPAPAPPRPLAVPPSTPVPAVPLVTPPPDLVTTPPPPTFSAPIIATSTLPQASGTSSVSLATLGGGGGNGGGLGPGSGVGVGPGTQAGFGGGTPSPGAGISFPEVLVKVSPTYTAEAMRMKIAGAVELDAIVRADGTVSDVRVTKSLDRQFGMDQAAVAAALKWVFKPARDRDGKPVAVRISIGFDLRLH